MLALLPEEETAQNKWQHVYPARSAAAFRLQSAISGKHVRLGDIQSEKAIITFVPGIWAPWCRRFLDDLSLASQEIGQYRTVLVAIISQDFDQVMEYLSTNPVGFEVLADPHGAISTRYGVFDEVIEEPMQISKPSVFVLDDEKNIHYKFFGQHLMDRPTRDDLIDVAQVKLPKSKEKRSFFFFRKLFYAGN
jgi:peroxiredoxin